MSSLKAPFNRLPNELKLQVFEELYQDSMTGRRDYINALKVCRQWNVLGMPLLWTYIPINERNIMPFVRSLEAARQTTGALVRNLSVRLSPQTSNPNAANSLRPIAASKQLPVLIASQLKELTSFSFVTSNLPLDPLLQGSTLKASIYAEHELAIPIELCASMINPLPLSCSTLEFSVDDLEPDENSAEERIQMPATNPFCEALRRRVPHLEHLRIQADEISPFVFDVLMTGPPLPKLQTLVLSLTSLNIPNQLGMQYTHLGPRYAPVAEIGWLNPQAKALASLQWQNIITRELHTSWQAGRFPSVTHLLVMGNQDPESIADYLRPFGRYHDEYCLYTVDVLLGEMEITPFVPFGHGLRSNHTGTDRYLKTVIYRTGDGQLKILDHNAAGIHLCTNRLWKTSTTGIRVVKETKEMSKYNLKWMEPMQQGIPLDTFCEKIIAENGPGSVVGYYLRSTMSTLRGGWIKSGIVEWYHTIDDETVEFLGQTEEQA
ncbi:unnamed protein product [Alternaria burnsii]|nr:unnamed protein product [Alternaria burnsii]